MSVDRTPKVLHAIVGHKLPTYFLNTVRSVRTLAPEDDVVIVDNASGLPALTQELSALQSTDRRVRLIVRTSNDLSRNTKVGGLYDAYREIVGYALHSGYDLLHLIQADMQMLWWGRSVLERAMRMYERFPECVNIRTTATPRDRWLGGGVRDVGGSDIELVGYGLSDTGLYHLGRWRERDMQFHDSQQAHAHFYSDEGLRVLCHPWSPVARIPWPAVVRNGEVKGREVLPEHTFLLRPLSDDEIAAVTRAPGPAWLEDVCTPWGWACLTPMSPTALEAIDYWVYRYRDLRAGGWRAALPTWERRGLSPGSSIRHVQRRPSWWQVALLPPWHELKRRIVSR